MTHTPAFSDYAPVSETVLLGEHAAELGWRNCSPHEYFDLYCDERGKNTGARLRHNTPMEGERERSMGCERPNGYSTDAHDSKTERHTPRKNEERASNPTLFDFSSI